MKKNTKRLCFCAAILILVYYHFLFSANERMDTIIKLLDSSEEFNDLELGRFGIVLLNRIFEMRAFNPYLIAFATLITLVIASGFLCYLINKATNGTSRVFVWIFPFLVYLSPCWFEQFYFSYQSFLMILGVLMLEISVAVMEYGTGKSRFLVPFLLTLIAFSVYQAFVPLMLCLSIGVILLRFVTDTQENPGWLKKSIAGSILVFLTALIGYALINGVIQSQVKHTDYLTSQILWGTMPLSGVIRSIFHSITSIVLMQGRLDMPAYPVSLAFSLLMLLIHSIQSRRKRRIALICFGWFLLQLTGFAMTFVLGIRPNIRTESALAMSMAFNFTLSVILASQIITHRRPKLKGIRKWLPRAACVPALICLYMSAGICFRLIYTDDMRYQFDLHFANSIISDLKAATAVEEEKKTVVFVGETDMALNGACVDGEVIGRSLFSFHRSVEATNTVILNLLSLHELTYPDMKQEEKFMAHQIAENMPDYPRKGSIIETENLIIVKLSNAYYIDSERLTAGIEAVSLPDHSEISMTELNCTPYCQVESINVDSEKMQINGFGILHNVDAREISDRIFLRNRETGDLYEVNAACKQHIRLTKELWRDHTNYDQGGFVALCPLSFFEDHPSEVYEVVIMISREDNIWLFTTDTLVSKRIVEHMPRTTIDKEFLNHEFE